MFGTIVPLLSHWKFLDGPSLAPGLHLYITRWIQVHITPSHWPCTQSLPLHIQKIIIIRDLLDVLLIVKICGVLLLLLAVIHSPPSLVVHGVGHWK